MKVIVDNKIPYIEKPLFEMGIDSVYLPGAEINSEMIKDADALIVRTRTHCDESLLDGSSVKFIATATIGFDHIDTEYCKKNGIVWANSPGCNSGAVEQYIHSSLLLLEKERNLKLGESTIGIVGVGHVGSRVARVARSLGMKVLLNDPPREDNGELGFVSLDRIKKECDVITFHTPLIKEGKYSTFHLANHQFFNSLEKTPFIINSSRGDVVDTDAIIMALDNGKIRDAIIDVWENEPNINRELLKKVFVGTQHIAGYSADGKANATIQSLSALCEYFNIEKSFNIDLPPFSLSHEKEFYSYDFNYLQIYNPKDDSVILKNNPERFEDLRSDYNLRREL